MHKSVLILFFLVATAITGLKAQTKEETFTKGVELFASGSTQEALDTWLTLYHQGYSSAPLCYNIGNAYFKMNEIPASILYYERALLLKPGDEDINYNLAIARTYVVDRFVEIPELFFIRWYNLVSLSLSTNKWALLSIMSFIIMLILASLFIYSSSHRIKTAAFWSALAFLVISSLSLAFSLRNKSLVNESGNAIIMSPVINGKSSPDLIGTDLFVLHEGTKVKIEDEVGDWVEVRLSDGNKGWVTKDCLVKI